MTDMTQIEKHEKAIAVLNLIHDANLLVKNFTAANKSLPSKWHASRIEVNKAIKARLENYYNNNFKI